MTTREDFEAKHPPKGVIYMPLTDNYVTAGDGAFVLTAEYNALYRGWKSHAAQSQQVIQDAARYRWIRLRLRIRLQEMLLGIKRKCFEIAIGHAPVDSQQKPGEGYLNPKRFEEDVANVDAEIDNAITKLIEGAGK